MKLYHGSTVEIKEIDIAKSKPNKDFGRGFYLSAEKILKSNNFHVFQNLEKRFQCDFLVIVFTHLYTDLVVGYGANDNIVVVNAFSGF